MKYYIFTKRELREIPRYCGYIELDKNSYSLKLNIFRLSKNSRDKIGRKDLKDLFDDLKNQFKNKKFILIESNKNKIKGIDYKRIHKEYS